MKIHQYREMMRYLTRKPLSDREVELVYNSTQQPLAASGEEQEYATGDRVGFAGGASKKILDLILETNKKLKDKKSMETFDLKTGEVIPNKEPIMTAESKSRKLTKNEIEDYEEAIGRNSEEWLSEGTVKEAEEALKKSKAEEAYYLQQYKMGKLDPVAGEKTQGRMNFLRKKAEYAEDVKDRRLFTLDEMNELDELEKIFEPSSSSSIDISDPKTAESFTEFAKRNDPEGFKKIQKIVDDINNKNILDDFDVKNREPNATGGRVKLKGGSILTGTGKDLEDNIKEDHKAFNDYRKSIGQGPIPLDNKYIQMWIRSRLKEGGRVQLKDGTKEPQKILPMDLESVALRLFKENLDNLTYNQKQTLYDHIEDRKNKKAQGGRVQLKEGTQAFEVGTKNINSFLNTPLGKVLTKQAPNFVKSTARVAVKAGLPFEALLGVAMNSTDLKEKGLSDLDALGYSALKGGTQEFLNFGDLLLRRLPPAIYKKFSEDKPILESLDKNPEYFTFVDDLVDKKLEKMSTVKKIDNRAEFAARKEFIPNITDTEVPDLRTTKEFNESIKRNREIILNKDPLLKKLYEKEKVVKDDLYIEPLLKSDSVDKEGILNLTLNKKDD